MSRKAYVKAVNFFSWHRIKALIQENPHLRYPVKLWFIGLGVSRPLSISSYLVNFSQFFSLLFTGLNCFRFQMRTDRGGECEIVLEFSSLILADVYHASVDKWRNNPGFQLQFYTERFIRYKLEVTDYKQCSFDLRCNQLCTKYVFLLPL